MYIYFITSSLIVSGSLIVASLFNPLWLWGFVLFGPIIVLGVYDIFQHKHAILRNFPILGRFRYILESIRPEINQYFVESNSEGVPFSREERSLVYRRAKKTLDTLPFGTQKNVNAVGYEWVNHSISTTEVCSKSLRVVIGGPHCKQPYNASLLNSSAMSYGSLSKNAIMALNGGAKDGGFAQNTGEGGVSPYHNELGGDLIWQIGTGYFGCRTLDGRFCETQFAQVSKAENIKMIEIKISQGAKPGHGGILPASKLTPEIAKIRNVSLGKDVLSPSSHSSFSTPKELLEFVTRLRELSGGKPVGFKLCVGKLSEFIAIGKAMIETGMAPDFISVDGGEGGTGAAPLEFSNYLGMPAIEGLVFVNNILKGFGLRDQIKILAGGKVTTAFGMLKLMSVGADAIYSARAMMMAMGCIQALRCNSNSCPSGVATQDPSLARGLVVSDKRTRVKNFHEETLNSLAHILGAMGLKHPRDLRSHRIFRRVASGRVKTYEEIFDQIEPSCLLRGDCPDFYKSVFTNSRADKF